MVRVKICGIKTQEALDAARAADWIGINFYPPSPRFLTPAGAAGLTGGPTRVGLFVRPTDDEIDAAVGPARLNILQVYTDPARASEIRRRVGLPVWRAIGIAEAADLPRAGEDVDGFVIESKAPADAARPAGNAMRFDWSLLDGWKPPMPWILAGGLDPSNVQGAIAQSGAPAVDVSSGVERERGVKDAELIRAFLAAARCR